MKLGFSLTLFAACCVGLTGCANWQNRTGVAGSPAGNTSMMPPAAPGLADPMQAAPPAAFGEAPPPMNPAAGSDPFLTLPPTQIPPERLNLSQGAGNASTSGNSGSPVPSRMYNLESSSAPKRSTAAGSTKSSERQSKTISRLASKSEPASAKKDSTTASSSDSNKAAAGSTTLAKLSRSASQDSGESSPRPTSLPKPETMPQPSASEPAPAAPQPATNDSDSMFDTSFLAQPVRKGADAGNNDGADDSKGPQSNHVPARGLGHDLRPVIYPVSNPVVDEPVDITHFT